MKVAKSGRSVKGNKAVVRAGMIAVSAATAGLVSLSAKGDITGSTPFGNFATYKQTGSSNTAGLGPNAAGTVLTIANNVGTTAFADLNLTPQTITSFDASWTLTATGSADGGTFFIDGSSSAVSGNSTNVVGGGGGSGGYDSASIPNSIALQWEFYTGSEMTVVTNGNGGTSPTYAYYYTAVPNQGGNTPALNGGDAIQFNLAYFGTTLTASVIDLSAHRAVTEVFSGYNISNTVGSTTAYVGFSGGTGGATSTQNISNFSFVSNKQYQPVALASGSYNEIGIINTANTAVLTATQDSGTNKGGNVWYEQGFDAASPTTGLPHAGTSFIAQTDNQGGGPGTHTFTMAPSYLANDVILLAGSAAASGPATATISFANNSQPYNALSFLTASGNGPNTVGLTINYADGKPSSTGLEFLSPDWFSGSPSAFTAAGRYDYSSTADTTGGFNNVGTTNPNLYAEDVVLPDNTDPIASITLTFLGGNRSPTGNVFIFAISGEAGAAGPNIVYTGLAKNGTFDNINNNFNGTSGSQTVPVNFVNGDQVTFDDTNTTSHTINIATPNMNASAWYINTSSGYTFYSTNSYGLVGPGFLSISGGGTVLMYNITNTFTGSTNINAGLLQMNSGAGLASTTINVAAGAALNVSTGAVLSASTTTSLNLSNSGTVNYFPATLKLASLSGGATGVLNLNGTALTIASSSYFGTIGGTSGSVAFTGGGTFGGTINDGTVSPIGVTINTGSGAIAFNGVNNYTGGTYLLTGLLQIGNSGAVGTQPITFEGGAVGGSSASTAASPVTVSNTFVFNQSTGLSFDAANPVIFTGGGTIALAAGTTPIKVSTHDGTSSNLQISAVFTDPTTGGSASLNLTGDFALTGSNTYSGGTTFNAATDVATNTANAFGTGVLNFNGGGIGTLSGSSGLVFANPFQFGATAAGYFENYSSFTVSGPGFLGTGATYNASTGFTGGNASGAVINVYVPQLTLSGQITGGALIVGNGSNVLELAGAANTFTGPIIVDGGSGGGIGSTLQLDYPGSIGGLNGANSATGTITVASGGTLLVNDNSGYLGLTGGRPGGSPITAVISGGGNLGNGAIAGPYASTGTWAGNINLSGPSNVSSGNSGTLILTGAIIGTGPLSINPNSADGNNVNVGGTSSVILSPPTSSSNTYTGGTNIASGSSIYSAFTVQLGATNGFSPYGGLNIVGGNGDLTIDLNGSNQSIAYLTGSANSKYVLTNSNSNSPSILTINNGSIGSTPANFGTTISGSNLSVVKTGTGNQILSGNNTYGGGTTVTQGTLSVLSSTALGTAPVYLNGGILAFPASNLTGVASFSSLNGSVNDNQAMSADPTISGTTIQLTTVNAGHVASSAFTPSKVTLNLTTGFTVSYQMNLNSTGSTGEVADGMGFVIQDESPTALGEGGGGLGYTNNSGGTNSGYGIGGITNSFIAGFETYTYNYGQGGVSDVKFGTNGALTQASTSGLSLTSQPVNVTLTYNGSQFTESLVGEGTVGGTYQTSFAVNLASVLGSSNAYIGFTGGAGDGTETATVTNFSITNVFAGATAIANPIVGNANTSSIIQIGVSAGYSLYPVTSLNLATGSVVTLATTNGSTGRIVLSTPSITIAQSSSGAYTAKLDIAGNDLDIPTSGSNPMTLAQVTSMVASGYAKGTWTGEGIASSAAANDSTHLTALGVIINDNGSGTPLYGVGGTISATLDGAAPADGDILVKYTYYGDANLDGAVDGSDYARIDNGFINGLTGWYNGDFNYDGVVDGSDYALIDNSFNTQGASLGSNPAVQIASPTVQIAGGGAISAVPEPASLALLTLGAAGLLGRRRRRI